jgi:hypothetical protein
MLHDFVEAVERAELLLAHGVDDVGDGRDVELTVNGRELIQRHRARLEEPTQIGREISDARFHQHPAACLVCPPQAFE